jgi:hypothetical protein
MVSRIGNVLGGALAAGTVGLALAPWASAATLPKAIDFWGMRPDYLAVRPSSLAWTTDVPNGAGSLNGTRGSSTSGPDSKISWNSWTASGATGSSDVWVSHLSPSGQSATYKGYPAKLSFSVPKTLSFVTTLDGGHYRASLVFTKMKVSFTGAVPAGWRRSKTFALRLMNKGFYFFAVPN